MGVGLTFEEANAGRAEQGRGARRVLKTLETPLISPPASYIRQYRHVYGARATDLFPV